MALIPSLSAHTFAVPDYFQTPSTTSDTPFVVISGFLGLAGSNSCKICTRLDQYALLSGAKVYVSIYRRDCLLRWDGELYRRQFHSHRFQPVPHQYDF
jgi:hypothetical protein